MNRAIIISVALIALTLLALTMLSAIISVDHPLTNPFTGQTLSYAQSVALGSFYFHLAFAAPFLVACAISPIPRLMTIENFKQAGKK